MMTQIIFIVWRESVEALLVVGILNAWISCNAVDGPGRRYLWGGVVAGLAMAAALAFLLVRFSAALSGDGLEYFQTGLMFLAGALIVQMVFWMRRHGRAMKRELEDGLSRAAMTGRWWAIFVLALIAVAREGSETVVFLYGMLAAGPETGVFAVVMASTTGLILAIATYGLLQLGGRILSWRLFFRITEAMLLLLACALFVTSVGNLVSLGFLPYTATLWDTTRLLDDVSRLGGVVASLTGYRATPDLATLATWIVFWSLVILIGRRQNQQAAAPKERVL